MSSGILCSTRIPLVLPGVQDAKPGNLLKVAQIPGRKHQAMRERHRGNLRIFNTDGTPRMNSDKTLVSSKIMPHHHSMVWHVASFSVAVAPLHRLDPDHGTAVLDAPLRQVPAI